MKSLFKLSHLHFTSIKPLDISNFNDLLEESILKEVFDVIAFEKEFENLKVFANYLNAHGDLTILFFEYYNDYSQDSEKAKLDKRSNIIWLFLQMIDENNSDFMGKTLFAVSGSDKEKITSKRKNPFDKDVQEELKSEGEELPKLYKRGIVWE